MDFKFEITTIPVADVDRAKAFYEKLGWRLDADFLLDDGTRAIQFTPPGSAACIHFGKGFITTPPGSAQGLYLIVDDVEAARNEIAGRGVEISEVFHEAAGAIPRATTEGRVPGFAPDRGTYLSFASFNDPDGNGWILQEITERLPGRE